MAKSSPFGLAPADAVAALVARGLTLSPSFAWQDVAGETHGQMFTVAKSTGFDILTDIFAGLKSALAEGKTGEQLARELTPVLIDKGWWGRKLVADPDTGEPKVVQLGSPRRLQTIFDANMRVSYAAGHWANFERNKGSRPYLRYVAILDERTRPAHRARHNVCLPVDHPWWNVWGPPNGWNCRCTVQSLSARDVDRMRSELRFEPPADQYRDWTNTRTGEVTRLPVGIDPGWGHNPGKAGWIGAMSMGEKLIDAPLTIAAAAGHDSFIVDGLVRQWQHWLPEVSRSGQAATGRLPSVAVVGALDRPVLDRLEAVGQPVATAALAVPQSRARHLLGAHKAAAGRAATTQDVLDLPRWIASPVAILHAVDGNLVYVGPEIGGEVHLVAVVRLNVPGKLRSAQGGRRPAPFNEIVSVGLMPTINLRDGNRYVVISGRL